MMRINLLFLVAFVVIAISSQSCTSRKSLPMSGPQALNNTEQAGEKIFMEKCQRCHPQGEAGLGPAIHWAPGFAKRFQVRHSAGTMPAFGEGEISGEELDQLMAYLNAVD